jgi:DNA-binding NtrC family response regulator/tetratricopeptide (TPR) repeat protein
VGNLALLREIMALDLGSIRKLIEGSLYLDALRILDSEPASDPDTESGADRLVLRIAALNGLGRWNDSISAGSSAIPALSHPNLKRQLSRLHGLLGVAYMRTGAIRDAEAHYRAAIHILTWELGDVTESLRQQRRLALMFHGQASWHQARFEMEKAIEIADQHSVTRESGGLRLNLAVTHLKSGGFARISTLLETAEASLSRIGQFKWLMQAGLVRANCFRISGHVSKALEILLPSLQTTREQQYSRQEAIALEYIGDCHLDRYENQKALEHYQLAFKIAEATAPDGDLIPELCHRMAEVLIRLGDSNAAIVLCERGLRVARAANDRYEECATYRVYAMAHRAAGNSKKALRIADEGIDLCRQYEIPYELGRTLGWAGEMRSQDTAIEEQTQGRRQLWEARGVFERMGLIQWVRSIDGLLGFDPQEAPSSEEPGLSAIKGLEDLDPGALRFGIITCNDKICDAVEILQSVAPSQIPVLITGESGVGKELLAQALHQMSPRRKAPFVPLNCGAISVNLLDSEFFGHERGAFTGAVASREGILASSDKGTLFLDEVGDLPLQVQAALLRVLETGEVRAVGRDDVRKVDIRIVAATNAGLEDLVGRGLFRQDLFYRLNGIRVTVPPLREREEDIKALFRYFWSQLTSSAKKRLKVDETVESLLCAYDWPGNVRELRNEVARVVALAAEGSVVGLDAFLPQLKQKDVGSLRRERDRRENQSEERDQIILALRAHRGNKAEAARSLGGMKRTTLIYKIERLGIRPEEYQVRK